MAGTLVWELKGTISKTGWPRRECAVTTGFQTAASSRCPTGRLRYYGCDKRATSAAECDPQGKIQILRTGDDLGAGGDIDRGCVWTALLAQALRLSGLFLTSG